MAIWDTGATSSCISPKLVKELGLHATKMVKVGGINNSKKNCNMYLVDFRLPNGVVVRGEVVGTQMAGADVLIGMDVISTGDSAISHDKSGNMSMSFIVPPTGKTVDFCKTAK